MKDKLICTAVLCIMAAGAAAQDPPDPGRQLTLQTGDPYELAGNRMVFTSWYYVRPGNFAWAAPDGNNVSTARDPNIGPMDAHFIRERMPYGIRLVAQPAGRSGPIFDLEKPWEGKGVRVCTLLKDGDRYRLWAACETPEMQGLYCYYESQDGVEWTRPEIGEYEYEGSKENNILPWSPESIFIDPSAPPEARYKGVSLEGVSYEQMMEFKEKFPDRVGPRAYRPSIKQAYAITGATSPDGLHWDRLKVPFSIEHSDTHIIATYDALRKKYVIYTRHWWVGERTKKVGDDGRYLTWLGETSGSGRRAIGRMESDDFETFPLSDLMLVPDCEMAPTEVLYTNSKTTIPGAPDQHLLFPAVWNTADDTTRIIMYTGTDGRVWQKFPGTVLETGDFGAWDGGCIFAHPNLVELADGDFALPYTGYNYPHKYARGTWRFLPGYAVWPKGRLIALQADEEGYFCTVAIMPPGRKLLINAVTRRAGSIKVAVSDVHGRVLAERSFDDCEPIVGDVYRRPVRWKSGEQLGCAENEAITLQIKMDRARLFSLDFE